MRYSRLKWLVVVVVVVSTRCASAPLPEGVLPADGQFELAVGLFEDRNFQDALRALQTFTFNYPQDNRVAEAEWMVAEASFAVEDWATSAQEHLTFQRSHPRHERAAMSLARAAEAYEKLSLRPELDQRDTERAINVYERILQEYPGTEQAVEARERRQRLRSKLAEKAFLNAKFYFKNEFYDAAEIYVTDLIANFPDTDWMPAALSLLGEVFCWQGLSDRATEAYITLESAFPDSEAARSIPDELPATCRPAPVDADDGGGDDR